MCILQALRFSMSKLLENGPNNGERKVGAGGKKVESGGSEEEKETSGVS